MKYPTRRKANISRFMKTFWQMTTKKKKKKEKEKEKAKKTYFLKLLLTLKKVKSLVGK